MTTDIEKQFFDMFGIEKKPVYSGSQLYNPFITGYDYSVISDRILLGLICILGNTNYFLITDEGTPIDVDGLKKSVLHSLTLQAKFSKNEELKQQVQALFKEG